MTRRRASIGVSTHLGWAATAAITVDGAEPRVVRTDHVELAKADDREVREPYHVAGGFDGLERVPPPADPERGLAKALARQRRAAARAMAKLAAALSEEGLELAVAGILVGRGRAAPTFEKAVGSHTQIHVEEGLAVRESFRRALRAAGARVVDVDQKGLWSEAGAALGRSEHGLRADLRSRAPGNGGPWRKEEQAAALAAWLAWTRARS